MRGQRQHSGSKRVLGVAAGALVALGIWLPGPAEALSQGAKPCEPWSSQQRAVGTFLPSQGAAPFSNWC